MAKKQAGCGHTEATYRYIGDGKIIKEAATNNAYRSVGYPYPEGTLVKTVSKQWDIHNEKPLSERISGMRSYKSLKTRSLSTSGIMGTTPSLLARGVQSSSTPLCHELPTLVVGHSSSMPMFTETEAVTSLVESDWSSFLTSGSLKQTSEYWDDSAATNETPFHQITPRCRQCKRARIAAPSLGVTNHCYDCIMSRSAAVVERTKTQSKVMPGGTPTVVCENPRHLSKTQEQRTEARLILMRQRVRDLLALRITGLLKRCVGAPSVLDSSHDSPATIKYLAGSPVCSITPRTLFDGTCVNRA